MGHVINTDYKFLTGKMVLNLLPPTLLSLEVSLLKVFFSAVCGSFGQAETTQNVSHMWGRARQGWSWNPAVTCP